MTRRTTLRLADRTYETALTRKFGLRQPWAPRDPRVVKAFIPGLVVEVLAMPGMAVAAGDSLLVLEAMKMQNHVAAQVAGRVRAVHVAPGETVAKGQLLVTLE